MIPVSSAASGVLTWSNIPRSRNYELKLNGEIVGTSRHPSFWSSSFLAEAQAGSWTFSRGGWLGTGAAIVDPASGQQIAAFKSSWGGGGILTFADGQTFHLGCKGWWHPVWTVDAENGQPIAHLHTREKTVDVEAGSGVPDTRLSLLILFAWCRILQAEEDAASAAATAAVIG